jgi:HlyD family secretion protein
MGKKVLLIVGVIVLVVAVPLSQRIFGGATTVQVDTEVVQTRSIQSSVLASGRLVHAQEAKLSTEEIGKVTEIFVEEGDFVTRGQLLLQIDDQRHRSAVEQNEASVRMQDIAIQRQQTQLDNQRRQWERMADLHARALIDDDSFDAATNALRIAEIDLRSSIESLSQARAQLEQAEDRLAKTRAYAPLDGTVTSLDIKVGETAISSSTNIPGSSLMTIADPASIHTEVNVDEADIANIAVGQEALVYAIAYPDQPVRGVIDSIAVSAKVAEGQQGLSFAVKIKLHDTEGITLRPGMSCRAEIFTAIKDDSLAVPIQAILVEEDIAENETTHRVFLAQGESAVEREVEVGLSDDTYWEIVGGLSGGETIVIGPDRVLRNLEDGDRIAANDQN